MGVLEVRKDEKGSNNSLKKVAVYKVVVLFLAKT